jgi:hypothetical protein
MGQKKQARADRTEKPETKRGRGRPQEYSDPVSSSFRIEREDLQRLDDWAREHALSRCQAMAVAIRLLK